MSALNVTSSPPFGYQNAYFCHRQHQQRLSTGKPVSLLPDQTYEDGGYSSSCQTASATTSASNNSSDVVTNKQPSANESGVHVDSNLSTPTSVAAYWRRLRKLREIYRVIDDCEKFLDCHGINDGNFFCQYRKVRKARRKLEESVEALAASSACESSPTVINRPDSRRSAEVPPMSPSANHQVPATYNHQLTSPAPLATTTNGVATSATSDIIASTPIQGTSNSPTNFPNQHSLIFSNNYNSWRRQSGQLRREPSRLIMKPYQPKVLQLMVRDGPPSAHSTPVKPTTFGITNSCITRIDEEEEDGAESSSTDAGKEDGCETSIIEEHRTFIRIGTAKRTKSRRGLRRVRSLPRSYRKMTATNGVNGHGIASIGPQTTPGGAGEEKGASSSNEAVHLQQRLRNLSSELVTLRSRLHVPASSTPPQASPTGSTTTPVVAGGVPQQQQQQQQPLFSSSIQSQPLPSPDASKSESLNTALQLGGGSSVSVVNQETTRLQEIQQHEYEVPGAASDSGINNDSKSLNGFPAHPSGNNPPMPGKGMRHGGVVGAPLSSSGSSRQQHHLQQQQPLSSSLPAGMSHSDAAAGVHSQSPYPATYPGKLGHQFPQQQQQFPQHQQRVHHQQQQHHQHLLHQQQLMQQQLHHQQLHQHQLQLQQQAHQHHHVHHQHQKQAPFQQQKQQQQQRLQQQQQAQLPQKPAIEIEDLIHLSGPLTEDAILKTLQARFFERQYFTSVGPILLSINPYDRVGTPLTLNNQRSAPPCPPLLHVVQEATRLQSETGYPQAIILSGVSGSGKTSTSMVLLRQLFDIAGGGPETDAFKHLAAAFTVLRSLGSAKTASNSESSRIGHFIEVQVTDGALYRTKIHCYFLDQTRVVRPLPKEKNYHIFYQMLAGLTPDERAKLNLEGYSVHNLRYLNCGDVNQDKVEDKRRFDAWRSCLGVLGIPFLDVVRVLAGVLLLGNIQFTEPEPSPGDTESSGVQPAQASQVKSVAQLLGVSDNALFQGLTCRTKNIRGQLVKTRCGANWARQSREALAKALYCRTVATIVRRANSLKRLGSTSGTLSSDSNESVAINQMEVSSQHASTIGTMGSRASKSMNVLNSAVRHANDGFIGILDMFGFEDPQPSQLEHLCINLCAETMQHFYNTHIFKSSVESCRDEGIQCDVEVDYVDNVPCIDLISSLRTGLLSMLDVECSLRGSPETYLQKVLAQHAGNPRLREASLQQKQQFMGGLMQVDPEAPPPAFVIRHFTKNVYYDVTPFLETNRDVIADDLLSVFHKDTCNFGFATHLFGSELKALYSAGQESAPRGISFRISPTSHSDLQHGDEPVSTLTQDFHTRLDNLLRTLVHAKPHFVRCIRANATEASGQFDRLVVSQQLRALQVLETVNLMAGGFPHRMRFKAFNARYRLLAPFKKLRRQEEKAVEDCQLILSCFAQTLDLPHQANMSMMMMMMDPGEDSCYVNNNVIDVAKFGPGGIQCPAPNVRIHWALGKRHIFLSEGARQQLDFLRKRRRDWAATIVQCTWRGWHFRRRVWPALKRTLELEGAMGVGTMAPSAANRAVTRLQQAGLIPSGPSSMVSHGTLGRGVGRGRVSGVGGAGGSNTLSRPPRPQPIAGTPPPSDGERLDRCDQKTIQHTCSIFGLDLERPPPLPPSRPYTVAGNTKMGYPQSRVMKATFPEEGKGEVVLHKGETVMVVGAGHRRGHLLVEHKNHTFQVPFQYLELKQSGGGM